MLYHTTTTDFYYIMQYATLYFFLPKIPTIFRKMSWNYLGNSILQNEDEHKGKNFFVGIRHSLCPTQKDFLLDSIQQHGTSYQKYGALYEQGRRGEKITSAKGQYFKLTGVSFIFLWDVSWVLYYFGVLSCTTFVAGHFLVKSGAISCSHKT